MGEEIDRSASCAFTGHRPASLPWGEDEQDPRCLALKVRLDESIARAYRAGYRHFLCGMAKGSDFYFCESVIHLRAKYPDIKLEAAVPFPGQSQRWNAQDRARYDRLLSLCDMETLIQQFYSPGCMQRRNHYMVDHASRLIAVFNGGPAGSGTLGTLHYALKIGVETDILEV